MTIYSTIVKTIKSGERYRATRPRFPGESYLFLLDKDSGMIMVYGKRVSYGLYQLKWFGGKLNPEGIRVFLDGKVDA